MFPFLCLLVASQIVKDGIDIFQEIGYGRVFLYDQKTLDLLVEEIIVYESDSIYFPGFTHEYITFKLGESFLIGELSLNGVEFFHSKALKSRIIKKYKVIQKIKFFVIFEKIKKLPSHYHVLKHNCKHWVSEVIQSILNMIAQ